MKTKSLLSCFLVVAALSGAAALFAEEVKEKDFDDGNGGHQSAIWVDGRPVFYSDFVKDHPPKKGALKAPPPPAAVAPGPPSPEESSSPGDRSPAGDGSSAASGGAAVADKAQASAAAAAGAGQAKTSARASSSMSRMADAMKSMLPKDPGAGAAPGAKGASTDAKGARLEAAAGGAAPGAAAVAPRSRPSAAPSAPAPDSPRALERRPDFFKVVSPEKYNELKNAYVLTGGSAQPGFRDIGSTGRDFVWTKSCTKGLEECNPEAAGKEEIHYDKNAIVSPETLKNIASEIEKKPPEEDLSSDEVAKIYAAMRAKVAAMEEADSEYLGVLKAKAPAPPAPLSSGETMEFDTGRPPSRPTAEGLGPVAPAAERRVDFTSVVKGLFTSAPQAVNGEAAGEPERGPGRGYLLPAASAAGALVLFIILARRRGRRQRSVAVDR